MSQREKRGKWQKFFEEYGFFLTATVMICALALITLSVSE